MTDSSTIIVVDYCPEWPQTFEPLRSVYKDALGDLILDVHHVGSTSVAGLAAKPVIDIDLVIESRSTLPEVIARLGRLGYEHRGDLGIPDREAFGRSSEFVPVDGSGRVWPKHHLYCCHRDCIPLRNHLALRDYLRAHPKKALEYGELKKWAAREADGNIDLYVELKTPFILDILCQMGLGPDDLAAIEKQNRRRE